VVFYIEIMDEEEFTEEILTEAAQKGPSIGSFIWILTSDQSISLAVWGYGLYGCHILSSVSASSMTVELFQQLLGRHIATEIPMRFLCRILLVGMPEIGSLDLTSWKRLSSSLWPGIFSGQINICPEDFLPNTYLEHLLWRYDLCLKHFKQRHDIFTRHTNDTLPS
jgi:hypothetical protein